MLRKPSRPAAPGPLPAPQVQTPWQKYGRGAIGALALSLLGPLLLMSESHLKEALDTAFSGCLLVLDVQESEHRVEVLGYMSGKTPDYINLIFRAPRGREIATLKFANGVLATPPTVYSSRVLHPLAGQSCPGKLCEAPLPSRGPDNQMMVRLPYPSSNYDYVFTAELTPPPKERRPTDRFTVVSMADSTKADTCRVEVPNAFNLLVRLDKFQRFMAYCAILLVGTMLMLVFKPWGSKP